VFLVGNRHRLSESFKLAILILWWSQKWILEAVAKLCHFMRLHLTILIIHIGNLLSLNAMVKHFGWAQVSFSLDQILNSLIGVLEPILPVRLLLLFRADLAAFIWQPTFVLKVHFLVALERFMQRLVHLLLHPLHIMHGVLVLWWNPHLLFKVFVTAFHASALVVLYIDTWLREVRHWGKHTHGGHHHWHRVHRGL